MDEKIHVGLYGGKPVFGRGRETPLGARIIFCDRAEQCGFYSNSKCLKVRSFLGSGCKYGKINTITGYTSRANKYHEFKRRYETDEVYGKLKYPNGQAECEIIGDEVCICLSYCEIKKQDNGIWTLDVPFGSSKATFVPQCEVTVEFLQRIFSFVPRSIFGYKPIPDYANKVLPDFCISLRRTLPDIYARFVTEYPQYDIAPNYIGKKALLHSLNKGDVEYRFSHSSGTTYEKWYWDGEYLTLTDGKLSYFAINITKEYDIDVFRIKPSSGTVVTISRNDQVNEGTVFE